MDIFEEHNKWFSLECVREMHSLLSIALSDMQILCVCVTLCNQHPKMIEMEILQRRYAEEGGADRAVSALTRDFFSSPPSYAQTITDICRLLCFSAVVPTLGAAMGGVPLP